MKPAGFAGKCLAVTWYASRALARPRGRFAPTPSGPMHLGNARTALLAWLSARAAGGEVLLRVEDADRPRVRAGAEQRILGELR